MDLLNNVAQVIDDIRARRPLIHQLTNFVTVNDCANITLAIGACPVMANDPAEAADMVKHADALVINIGVLNGQLLDTMIAAGNQANTQGIPVIFDPVGTGSTPFRTAAAGRIITEVPLAVVRGNMSEIMVLAGRNEQVKGVDSTAEEMNGAQIGCRLSQQLGCVVVITGQTDVIAWGDKVCYMHNGHALLRRVTGTGCMATALIGCSCAAADNNFVGAIAGIAAMGIAGEIAAQSLQPGEGLGSFKVRLVDAMSAMTSAQILKYAKLEFNQKE